MIAVNDVVKEQKSKEANMKNIRKIAGICAAALAAAGTLSSCGNGNVSTGAEVKLNGSEIYPIECEDTLTYWMGIDPRLEGAYTSFGETPLGKEVEKRTGVKVEYVHPQIGQETEQFNILLASNELPDIVTYNWAGYAGGPDQAIDEEYIYKLNDVFEKYAPALTKYLSQNPDVDKKIKTDNGSYYVFPFVRGEEWMTCSQGLILRKDWLDKLGLEEPKTLDELETALRGFKTLGASAPLVLNTEQLQMMLFAYGTAPDFYVNDGKVVYGYATQEYKKALEKIASWYSEGLLDNNLVSVDTKYIQSRVLNGDAGAFYGYVVSGLGALLDAKPSDDFKLTAVAQPTQNGGKPEFSYKEDNVLAASAAAISTNCKNVELAARFLDFGFTEEGHMLYNFGIEGESYEMADDEPVFTDLITDNPEGLTFVQAAVRYSRAPSSGIFVQDPAYVKQSLTYPEEQQKAYDMWSDTNMSEHLLPPTTLLSEEQNEYAEIMNNVNTYVSEKKVAFVTGKESIDGFDAYLEQLKAYNLDRALELRQNAFDRYNNK